MKFIISEKKRLPNVATTDIKNAKKLNIKQSAVSLIISRKIKMITKQIYGQDVNKETRKKLDKYKKMREKNQLIK